MTNWNPLKYETIPWKSSVELEGLSRSSKSKILPTYQSSIPNTIAEKNIILPADLDVAISDLMINIGRFDLLQTQKGYSFPSVLLRSESAASSQIENLTSSIRNIALAELTNKGPTNALLIAGNVFAMKKALNISEKISNETILHIHKTLMESSLGNLAGEYRNEPVWIGGTSYSPHQATFVPVHHSKLEYYMNDLVIYSKRINVNPIVKAAILHAQFETIHPFVDGNGRTGRTLIHKSLKDDGVLHTIALPISAGLLNNLDSYLNSLKAYQEGNPLPIIEQVFKAIELSLAIGENVSAKISSIIQNWENIINERKTSTIWKLIYLLIEQPVINTNLIKEKLHLTLRGANKLIDRAIGYGILTKFGNQKKGMFYQSSEIIAVLDDITQIKKLYRI